MHSAFPLSLTPTLSRILLLPPPPSFTALSSELAHSRSRHDSLAGQAPNPDVPTTVPATDSATAAKVVPPQTDETAQSGYDVPATQGQDKAPASTPAPAAATAAGDGTKQPPAPGVVKKQSQTKSKGGLFSCCGKSEHYD